MVSKKMMLTIALIAFAIIAIAGGVALVLNKNTATPAPQNLQQDSVKEDPYNPFVGKHVEVEKVLDEVMPTSKSPLENIGPSDIFWAMIIVGIGGSIYCGFNWRKTGKPA